MTLANKIALLEHIEKQPRNTSHHRVPKSAIARVTQQQEKMGDEWTLCHGQQGTSCR